MSSARITECPCIVPDVADNEAGKGVSRSEARGPHPAAGCRGRPGTPSPGVVSRPGSPRTSTAGSLGLIGQDTWHQQLQGDRDAWQQAITALAAELLASPQALSSASCRGSALPRPAALSISAKPSADRDGEGVLLEQMLGDTPGIGGDAACKGLPRRPAPGTSPSS